MNRSGYSPVQRQIGQWPRLPGSLMSDEFLDPALQLQNTSDEFDHLLELRRLAQEACVELRSKDAAVKSLKARSRIQRIFKAGDVVYVYRALRRKKSVRGLSAARGHGLGRKATWVGPGHVLVPEGSVVWINMFGELWRASIEQTREATTMEKLGVEMVAEGFQEMQERLKRSSHKAGYRDVTQDTEELEDMPADEEGQRRGQPECVLLYKTMSQRIVARCLRKTFQPCQKRSLRSQRMRSCKHGTINDVLLGRLFQSQMPKVQCVSPTWRMSSQFLTIMPRRRQCRAWQVQCRRMRIWTGFQRVMKQLSRTILCRVLSADR